MEDDDVRPVGRRGTTDSPRRKDTRRRVSVGCIVLYTHQWQRSTSFQCRLCWPSETETMDLWAENTLHMAQTWLCAGYIGSMGLMESHGQKWDSNKMPFKRAKSLSNPAKTPGTETVPEDVNLSETTEEILAFIRTYLSSKWLSRSCVLSTMDY